MKIVFGERKTVFGILLFFGALGSEEKGSEGLILRHGKNSLGAGGDDSGGPPPKNNDDDDTRRLAAFITSDYNDDDDKDDETTHSVDYEYFGGKFDLPYWIVGTVFPCSELDRCTYLINDLDIFAMEEKKTGEENNEEITEGTSPAPPTGLNPTAPFSSSSSSSAPTERLGPACVTEGRLETVEPWYAPIGSYRLRPSNGRLYYLFEYPTKYCCPRVGFYLDEQVNRFTKLTNCSRKETLVDEGSPQAVTLDPSSPASGCLVTGASIHCRGGRLLQSDVIRRWHVAISNCAMADHGLRMRYTLLVYGLVGSCPHYYSDVTSGYDDPVRGQVGVVFGAAALVYSVSRSLLVHSTDGDIIR